MKKRITLIENSLNEDSEMIVWEFLKLSEQFTWKFHEDKSCFKAHKKWKHIEWSQSLKNNVKDIYNNPQYITEDEKSLIDFHKHFAIQINNIENEIDIYYRNNGNKYQKLSDFYNWYKNENNIKTKEAPADKFLNELGIESLMNLY